MISNKFRSIAMMVALLGSLLTAGLVNVTKAQDYKIYRVEAFSAKTFTVECSRGEIRTIGIMGDGDNDLDLYVYDDLGVLIDSSERAGDEEYVRWKARYQGTYKIKVVNRGSVFSNFALIWN